MKLVSVPDSGELPSVIEWDIPTGKLISVAGDPGPRGEPGEPGPPGPAFDGTAWFYGVGPPDVIIGAKPDDRYMDTLTGTIYTLGGN